MKAHGKPGSTRNSNWQSPGGILDRAIPASRENTWPKLLADVLRTVRQVSAADRSLTQHYLTVSAQPKQQLLEDPKGHEDTP
mmetsp:Transcript_2009/g.4427  ORF Transcript_2009/g.4427 Transcript_2009/m.4427 type:complete len:82 (-) Transcript_2009:155-400(-)